MICLYIFVLIRNLLQRSSCRQSLLAQTTMFNSKFEVCLSVHRRNKGRRHQLDYTKCFIELVVRSTCFGHVYAHHQELATMLLVWHVACCFQLLVVGRSGTGQQALRPDRGMLFDCSCTAFVSQDA